MNANIFTAKQYDMMMMVIMVMVMETMLIVATVNEMAIMCDVIIIVGWGNWKCIYIVWIIMSIH